MNYGSQPPYGNQFMGSQYQVQNNNGLIWVSGQEGMKAYQMRPNTNVPLFDSENDGIFYIKIADETGMCKVRTFKYEEILDEQKSVDLSNYITREEFFETINELKKLNGNSRKGGNNHAEQTVSGTV